MDIYLGYFQDIQSLKYIKQSKSIFQIFRSNSAVHFNLMMKNGFSITIKGASVGRSFLLEKIIFIHKFYFHLGYGVV
jgi:hypothetical protein